MAEQEARRDVPPPFKIGFETYLSPFSYRYGSSEMRAVWSLQNFWAHARNVWISVAETQHEAGLVTLEQLNDLRKGRDDLSVERLLELEKELGHDVMGGIAEFGEAAPIGGGVLHRGMTSEDVLSNVEIIQIHEAFDILRPKLIGVLEGFGPRIEQYKDLVCMGWTHLQAAEPTTMGYRFAKYAQDLVTDLEFLDYIRTLIRGKGIKGPVGTSASVEEVLAGSGMSPQEHEAKVMERLGIEPVLISDQTYPRKFLFLTQLALASMGQSLHRFALDIQFLQSSAIDEVSEPRRKGQKGSSAMPHKANPIISENIDSITEVLPGHLVSSWTTGAFVSLERTLRDSAGKREWLPSGFLIVDEALQRAEKVIKGLKVHENSVQTNLRKFAPYMVTGILVERMTNAGMDRNEAHDILVEIAEQAQDGVRSGKPNPMRELVMGDQRVVLLLGEEGIDHAFSEVFGHIGDASERCDRFLHEELYLTINGFGNHG